MFHGSAPAASGRLRTAGLAVVALLALIASLMVSTSPPRSASAAPAATCGDMTPVADAAGPADLARRYGLTAMHAAGDDGRGVTAAVLQFGMSVDELRFHEFQRCMGIPETPMTQSLWQDGAPVVVPWVDPRPALLPDPGREAQSDVDVITSTAVGLEHLYVLVSPTTAPGSPYYERLADMIDSLRTGAATGGRRPDVVSLSYGLCEADLTPAASPGIDRLDASLKALADAGTWFFKGSGDAGSSDCSPFDGPTACSGPSIPSAHFPATSPFVTAVGGLQIPRADSRVIGGVAEVWNTSAEHGECSGGGGGLSVRYDRPAFQDAVPGGAAPVTRAVPDISALAGSPGFTTLLPPKGVVTDWTWVANHGDSLSGPLYAGAFASLRSALLRLGVTPPVHLNDLLYQVANDPTLYEQVFRDVNRGDNATFPENRVAGRVAYSSTIGFDLASGLGEVRIDALLEVLAPSVVPAITG